MLGCAASALCCPGASCCLRAAQCCVCNLCNSCCKCTETATGAKLLYSFMMVLGVVGALGLRFWGDKLVVDIGSFSAGCVDSRCLGIQVCNAVRTCARVCASACSWTDGKREAT